MTGFSHIKFEGELFSAAVEVKSLNSKSFDALIRLPKTFSNREMEVRSRASAILRRGKISITVDFDLKGTAKPEWSIDRDAFHRYYDMLKALQKDLGADSEALFGRVLDIPEVAELKEAERGDDHWQELAKVIDDALAECDKFRQSEGKNLSAQLSEAIGNIQKEHSNITRLEKGRIDKIRNRIEGNISDLIGSNQMDENRMEQEIIYYLEKLDISEELVRMQSHLEFFKENLNAVDSRGKKLGFISQEIGREINTIGSKANDAQIQQIVVEMKDELEKIKEQLLNIL